MSFATEVKNEVSRVSCTREELISELSAIIRNCATIEKSITVVLENNAVARRIFKLFRNLYDVTPVITVRAKCFNNGYTYILCVSQKQDEILSDLSIINNGIYQEIPNGYLYSDEDLIRAYLRGVFLSSASINDPKTSKYHLELLVDSMPYANFIKDLLNNYHLNSKVITREKKYMIYIKEAEKISDFLRLIKAYHAVLYFEDIRIYRDHKNMTNRLNNCEQANMDKVFFTANSQIKDIEKITANHLDDVIDQKLQEIIKYRMKYPEASLSELSTIMNKDGLKITKSGLNHRFRKIKEIASRIDNTYKEE